MGCDMPASRGGYNSPVNDGIGYRLVLSPDCLVGSFAIGQQSTDSTKAGNTLEGTGTSVVRCSRASTNTVSQRRQTLKQSYERSSSAEGSPGGSTHQRQEIFQLRGRLCTPWTRRPEGPDPIDPGILRGCPPISARLKGCSSTRELKSDRVQYYT